MYLIDETYFTNKLEIQGIFDSNNGIAEKLNDYIDIYVSEFLQKLLGVKDFNELKTHIEGALNSDAPEKWAKLIHGTTYTYNGVERIYDGLIKQKGSVKTSILANYVYCKLMADLETLNGKAVVDPKSSTKMLPRNHFVTVFNEIASEFICTNMYPSVRFIGSVKFIDYLKKDSASDYVTLSEFIIENEIDYPNANVSFIETINQFDL